MKIKKKAPAPAKVPFRKDVQITMRVPPEIRRWLQARVDAETKAHPGRSVTISDVAREVFFAAMASKKTASQGEQ